MPPTLLSVLCKNNLSFESHIISQNSKRQVGTVNIELDSASKQLWVSCIADESAFSLFAVHDFCRMKCFSWARMSEGPNTFILEEFINVWLEQESQNLR